MKFRQWLSDGRIHYWGLIERESDGKEVFIMPAQQLDIDLKDATMQVFTERYDKFGRELYAGDVVLTSYDDMFQLNPFGGQFVELCEDEELILYERHEFEQVDMCQVWVNFWRA